LVATTWAITAILIFLVIVVISIIGSVSVSIVIIIFGIVIFALWGSSVSIERLVIL